MFVTRTVAVVVVAVVSVAIVVTGLIVGLTTRSCEELQETTTLVPSTQPPTATASKPSSSATIVTTMDKTTPEPTTPVPTARPELLLPGNIVPTYYSLYLWPDLTDFKTSGWVDITVTCTNPTSSFIVHSTRSKCEVIQSKTSIRSVGSENALKITAQKYIEEKEFFEITLDKALNKDGEYVVHLEFEGNVEEDLAGLYLSSYTDADQTVKYLVTTQMQPTNARRAFPCFDEPKYKAVFNVTLVRAQHMLSLSNMDIVSESEPAAGWVADNYEETPQMSSYLLCFVICEFKNLSMVTARGLEVRAWARPELIHQAEYALNTTAAIMEAFEDYFNLSYPLKKTELIAIPDFSAGAMENWGLVTYREERMLYEEGVSTSADKKSIARVIGHELTHMWFGNLVTCEWWDHLWLNEGFASYFQYVGADFVEPEWMLLDQFVVDNNPLAFASDALATSHPVVADVLTNSEIQGIFDRISYQKGGALSQMMQAMLHEDVWLAGLMEHLKRLPYKTANTDQLWESIQSAVDAKGVSSRLDGMTVKEVMDTWTLQSGYPLLNVSIDYASGDVTVSQSHFLLDPTGIQPPDSDYGYKWEVPFFYTTASEGNFETPNVEWLHPDRDVEMTISENNWLIGNAGVKGFYRVMYDDKNWENIINQLKDSHTKINTRNRAQLFEDAFTLAKALLMNQTHALELTEYLNDESDYLPWHTALTQLSYLDLMLSRSSSYGLFKAYMVLQIDKLYNEIGWQIYSDEEQMKTFTQVDALSTACKYGHVDCVKTATDKYRQWMTSLINDIAPDVQELVYCTAIANGNEEEWNFAWEQFNSSNVASEETKLLRSMACTNEMWILETFLKRALLMDGIKRTQGDSVISYVANNVVGNVLAWDFLRENWSTLYGRYKHSFSAMDRMVKSCTDRFNTQWEQDQVEAFTESILDEGGSEAYWKGAKEKIHANVKWRVVNADYVEDWLQTVQ